MTPSGQTICLCMIVKNEAPVIRRCLASVRPLIDHWIIVDTGSTDGTQAIVREDLRDIPGELVERPWRDFAHNRTQALALARPHGDYSLIIDADDTMDVPEGFRMPELDADSYAVNIDFGAIRYSRPQIVKAARGWRYEGVIHEYLACDTAKTSGHLPLVMRIHQDGARRRDPETYKKDVAVLERAVIEETDPFKLSRYTFYLAQSYRDSGQGEKALTLYLKRADMGFWQEEVYCSLLYAGRLSEILGRPAEAIFALYHRATGTCPARVEARHAASRFHRSRNEFTLGYDVAKPALDFPTPAGGLFVEGWIYDHGLLDEFAVNAYWAGRYRDSLDAGLRALTRGRVPEHERARFLANMRFAFDKLPEEPANIATTLAANVAPASARTARLPTAINLGSGKDFREDRLNIDVDPSWNPDVVIDLSAVALGSDGVAIKTRRFGEAVLLPNSIDSIIANDVLEHVPNLVALMTTCLGLLRVSGTFDISVPYDLSFGAWQDPTHVRTFNERSWLYYTDWFWYLGWRDCRFVVDRLHYVFSPLGTELKDRGMSDQELVRMPRAVDSMSVRLRKIDLTPSDRNALSRWRDRKASPPVVRTDVATTAEKAFAGTWEENRNRYCIWTVTPEGYQHARAFDEVAATLSAAFAALGGSAPVISRDAWGDRRPIVLAAHLLPALPTDALTSGSVLYNFEQVDNASAWLSDSYLSLLRRHAVLDYSLVNTRALHRAGISHALHLPFRAMLVPDAVERLPERDIDVLFVGSSNERRSRILAALREQGLRVVDLFGVYGRDRDAVVDRAKLVVNVHYYEAAVFEAVRVTHLMARGACVVSEGRADDPDSVDLSDGLILCSYDEIVDRCVSLVQDETRCVSLRAQARTTMASHSQAQVLRAFFAGRTG